MDRIDPKSHSSSGHRRGLVATLLLLPALLVGGCGLDAPPSGHSISGAVTGEVRAGVNITLGSGGATARTTTTGPSGGYSFARLAAGPYLVTAALEGYTFAPHAGQAVLLGDADVGGQDFIATARTHAIRGTIRGAVAAGVQVDLSGAGTSASTSTAADGTFSFLGVPDSTYVVTPVLAGHGFSPGARTVTLSGADASGQDFVSSVATAPLHAISGSVVGAVAGDVTITLERGSAALASTLTDATGGFVFPDLADGAYTVTPSRSGFAFAPRSQAVALGGADAVLPAFSGTASTGSSQLGEMATGGRVPFGIAIGNDLDAWLTDGVGAVVTRVRLQDAPDGARGEVTDFPVGDASAAPTAIALRFFGLRCFTEPQANRIGCISWSGGDVFAVDIPTPASRPSDVVNGPGASPLSPDIWFAEHDAGKVGRMRVASGDNPTSGTMVAEYDLPAGCRPTSLAWTGGNVWWAAEGCGRIGWIDPATGLVQAIAVDVGQPISLAPILDEPGAWFVDAASDRLGRLTAAGGLSWFSPSVPGSKLSGVANGPDQAVYVTEQAGNSIARLPYADFDPRADPNAGRLTQEMPLPVAGSLPFRITGGTDGNVWFTERGRAAIGVVHMPTHCIMGKVTLADLQTPVPAVSVALAMAGGGNTTGTTTAEGHYGFCGLVPGSYTVTPSLGTRTFVPRSLAVTMATSNLVGRSFVAE
ncbi:MAG: carboxypeptidase regulatory-like domain-containing protein [Deltaproteobacteria bacterium]|nr:carboxypeptidase regulatory-like domain-containing protein [Deltaproteobacteria bacterium]